MTVERIRELRDQCRKLIGDRLVVEDGFTVFPRPSFPKVAGLYVADGNDKTLYVGAAINLHERWSGKHHRIRDLIETDCSTILWFAVDREFISAAEKRLIRGLRPLFNGKLTAATKAEHQSKMKELGAIARRIDDEIRDALCDANDAATAEKIIESVIARNPDYYRLTAQQRACIAVLGGARYGELLRAEAKKRQRDGARRGIAARKAKAMT